MGLWLFAKNRFSQIVLVYKLPLLQIQISSYPHVVDAQQLLYHVVWPHKEDCSVLFDNMKSWLSRYPACAEKVLVIDKYDDL